MKLFGAAAAFLKNYESIYRFTLYSPFGTMEKKGEKNMEEEKLGDIAPKEEKRSRKLTVIAVIEFALILVMVIQLRIVNSRLIQVENRLQSVQGDVQSIDDKVSSSVNSIAGQVEESLNRQADIMSSFSYDLGELNEENKTVALSISGVPKEYKEGMKLSYSIVCDGEVYETIEPEMGEGYVYCAKTSIPLCDELRVNIIIETEDGVKTQGDRYGYYGVKDNYVVQFYNADYNGSYSYYNGTAEFDGHVACNLYETEENKLKSLKGHIELNGKKAGDFTFIGDKYGSTRYEAKVDTSFKANIGDTIDFVVEGRDSAGLNYKMTAFSFFVSSKDSMDMEYNDAAITVH